MSRIAALAADRVADQQDDRWLSLVPRVMPDISAEHAARILARPHSAIRIPAGSPEGIF